MPWTCHLSSQKLLLQPQGLPRHDQWLQAPSYDTAAKTGPRHHSWKKSELINNKQQQTLQEHNQQEKWPDQEKTGQVENDPFQKGSTGDMDGMTTMVWTSYKHPINIQLMSSDSLFPRHPSFLFGMVFQDKKKRNSQAKWNATWYQDVTSKEYHLSWCLLLDFTYLYYLLLSITIYYYLLLSKCGAM